MPTHKITILRCREKSGESKPIEQGQSIRVKLGDRDRRYIVVRVLEANIGIYPAVVFQRDGGGQYNVA